MQGGFTLVEVLVVMGLSTTLIVACFGAICSSRLISARSTDYIVAMNLAQAKMNDIRATDYRAPNFLTTQSTTNTNSVSVDLNQGGTSFLVNGTITSVIQPITWGHLVTVTVVIQEPNRSITNVLQAVVNEYSGGRGN